MTNTIQPLIICLEGADGSGKTTQVQLLLHCLVANGIKAIASREPGGSKIGEKLRKLVLKEPLNQITNILLYTTIRYNHIVETITPELNSGNIVILDRYLLSTLVYQAEGNKELIKKIQLLHQEFNNNLYPDLTLVLEVDPELAIERINTRKEINYYDQKPLEYHKKIAYLYQTAIKEYQGKVAFVDANLNLFDIHNNIISQINSILSVNLKPLTNKEIILYFNKNI